MPPVGQSVFAEVLRKTAAFSRREAKMPPLQRLLTFFEHLFPGQYRSRGPKDVG